jgi:3'-phosphoadenosine 5'-phosphosulfate (PAPS) 3'-phosphatase
MASQGSDPTPEFSRSPASGPTDGLAPTGAATVDLDDLDLACEIMHDATNLAVAARRDLPHEAIVDKADGSVVTAVDVALQVFILTRLQEVFGAVPTIAEEDLGSIAGKPAAEAHCRRLLAEWGYDGGESGIRRALSSGGLEGSTRDVGFAWVLDPIDGTQGFVDGDHWCPCLALLRRGEVVFAANGHPSVRGGALLTAVKDGGSWWFPLAGGEFERAEVSQEPLRAGESVRLVAPARATESQMRARTAVGRATGHPCTLVHSDSQAKYAHVIAGLADVAYSRRGGGPGKYVWDHAGAILLAREAGAWVGDTDGGDIDLSLGRRLGGNRAVICTARGLGPAIARELAARDVAEGFMPSAAAAGATDPTARVGR